MAKLHISYQFKKQCEKSDAKLRQYLNSPPVVQHPAQMPQQNQNSYNIQQTQLVQVQQNIQQVTVQPSQNNCVFVECNTLIDMKPDQQRYEGQIPALPTVSVAQPQPALTQINYNVQNQQNHIIGGYSLQPIGQVQVYNGYAMPIPQQMTAQANVQNQGQILGPPMTLPQEQNNMQAVEPLKDDGDKTKRRNGKIRKDGRLIDNQNKQVSYCTDSSIKINEYRFFFQCPTCGKEFPTGTKLSRHMKTHSAEMPHKCKICQKAFAHSGNYKIHLRMHNDERPYRCTICNKGCRQAQDLEKHMRIHTGERPHACSFCSKAFSTSSNLIAHVR